MFENIVKFFKKLGKKQKENSGVAAKERLHLVLAQDRANISADFLEMMKQEIIEVIKKYIDIDEEAIDVRMTNKPGEDGTVGAPALYANIPIVTIKNDARKLEGSMNKETVKEKKEDSNEEESQTNNDNEEKIEDKSEETSDEKEVHSTQENNDNKEETENISNTENNEENVKEDDDEKKDS